MGRVVVEGLVAGIDPVDDVEARHRAEALAWVRGGHPLYRGGAPDVPSPHLVAYFAVCDPTTRSLLLVHHRKADLWLPTGGHVEPDEHPQRTVEREAVEELGLIARFRQPDPLFVTVTPTRGTAPHVDVSLWYVLTAGRAEELTPDPGEFHAVRWFDLDGTDFSHGYDPHLGRFAAKLAFSLSTALVSTVEDVGQDTVPGPDTGSQTS